MKKILVLTMVVSTIAFAQTAMADWAFDEDLQCVTSDDANKTVECMQKGYICDLTVDVRDARSNTFAFYLSLDPSCVDKNKFFKSKKFPTTYALYKINEATGEPIADVKEDVLTRFCLINDDNYAGAQSMTLIGSVMLSAFNNSTPILVSYRKGPLDGQGLLNQYGGVRVKNITLLKPTEPLDFPESTDP